jgi:hypothetical protein
LPARRRSGVAGDVDGDVGDDRPRGREASGEALEAILELASVCSTTSTVTRADPSSSSATA